MLLNNVLPRQLRIRFLASTAAVAFCILAIPGATPALGQTDDTAVMQPQVNAEQIAKDLLQKYISTGDEKEFEALLNGPELKGTPLAQQQVIVASIQKLTAGQNTGQTAARVINHWAEAAESHMTFSNGVTPINSPLNPAVPYIVAQQNGVISLPTTPTSTPVVQSAVVMPQQTPNTYANFQVRQPISPAQQQALQPQGRAVNNQPQANPSNNQQQAGQQTPNNYANFQQKPIIQQPTRQTPTNQQAGLLSLPMQPQPTGQQASQNTQVPQPPLSQGGAVNNLPPAQQPNLSAQQNQQIAQLTPQQQPQQQATKALGKALYKNKPKWTLSPGNLLYTGDAYAATYPKAIKALQVEAAKLPPQEGAAFLADGYNKIKGLLHKNNKKNNINDKEKDQILTQITLAEAIAGVNKQDLKTNFKTIEQQVLTNIKDHDQLKEALKELGDQGHTAGIPNADKSYKNMEIQDAVHAKLVQDFFANKPTFTLSLNNALYSGDAYASTYQTIIKSLQIEAATKDPKDQAAFLATGYKEIQEFIDQNVKSKNLKVDQQKIVQAQLDLAKADPKTDFKTLEQQIIKDITDPAQRKAALQELGEKMQAAGQTSGSQIAHTAMANTLSSKGFTYTGPQYVENHIDAVIKLLEASKNDPAVLASGLTVLEDHAKTVKGGHETEIKAVIEIAKKLQDPNQKNKEAALKELEQKIKDQKGNLGYGSNSTPEKLQSAIHTYRVPIVEAHGPEKLQALKDNLKNLPNPETPSKKAQEIYVAVITNAKYNPLARREQIYYGEFYTDMAVKVKELQQTNPAAALQLEKLLQRDFHEAMDKDLTGGANGNGNYTAGTMYNTVAKDGTAFGWKAIDATKFQELKEQNDYKVNSRNLQGDLDTHYGDLANQKAHAEQQGHLTARVQESHAAFHEGTTQLGDILQRLGEHHTKVPPPKSPKLDAAFKTITQGHEKIKIALDTHKAKNTTMTKAQAQEHKKTIAEMQVQTKFVIDNHGDLTTQRHAEEIQRQLVHMQAVILLHEEEEEKAASHAAALAAKQHP